jgi:tRNA-specific 2-thiouridylase
MSSPSVGVAMSGGVDSTVCAALLLREGYRVSGFFMELGLPGGTDDQKAKLQALCNRLDIPLHCIDLRRKFQALVIDYFLATYLSGKTPNPCVICNHRIKFGLLQDSMVEQGMEYVATGHYARLFRDVDGSVHIRRGVEPEKDQSYFLCRLQARQLQRLLLPLGDHEKSTIYQLAKELGLGTFPEGESQDVCFLAGHRLTDFFTSRGIGGQAGPIVDGNGREIGRHRGLHHYTIGQRKGLGLPDASPWYVTGLDPLANRVMVGKHEELFQQTVVLRDAQYHQLISPGWSGLIQLRSRQQPVECRIDKLKEDRLSIFCPTPQRAVTPGQFGALYEGEQLIGSGIIQ